MKRELTQEQLRSVFNYNPETGWFTNKFTRGPARRGNRAGSPSGHGYRKLSVNYVRHYEHHLAWLYVCGVYPDEIDHIDGNRSNNAIVNLRIATRAQNNYNAIRPVGASGLRGAYFDKRTMRWYSHIQVGKSVRHLGMFNSPEEAHVAFMEAYKQHAGEFAHPSHNLERSAN